MKKILFLLLLFQSTYSLACECMPPQLTDNYMKSDVVARVKIIKNYQNEDSEEIYKSDIKIIEQFKGEKLSSIYIAGRSDNKLGSSCSIFIPVGTELILFTSINRNDIYVVGACSRLQYLNHSHFKRQKRALNILETLKSKKVLFTSKIKYQQTPNSHNFLDEFKGLKLNKNFALFELTFKANLTVKKVEKISGFDNEIDSKLIEILEKTSWSVFDCTMEDRNSFENEKLLIAIYYYPSENGYESFLSRVYL